MVDIIACLLLIQVVQSQNVELYKQMEFPNEIWSPLVYLAPEFTKSVIECGSTCLSLHNQNVACHGFKFKSKTCHLINLDQVTNLISSHSEDSVHLNLNALGNYMESLGDLYNVTHHDYWFEKITQAKVMTDPVVILDCWNYCVNVLRSACDFFVFDKTISTCYFGLFSHTEGTEPEQTLEGDISLIGVKGIF